MFCLDSLLLSTAFFSLMRLLCSFFLCFCFFLFFFFFFSSRRRHTRLVSDWSSDVCSSDLASNGRGASEGSGRHIRRRDSIRGRSEEHTSELQSLTNLVCRLLLEKKKLRREAGGSVETVTSRAMLYPYDDASETPREQHARE